MQEVHCSLIFKLSPFSFTCPPPTPEPPGQHVGRYPPQPSSVLRPAPTLSHSFQSAKNILGRNFSRKNIPTFVKSSHTSHLPAYEDGIECFERSAYKVQTPGELPRTKHTTLPLLLLDWLNYSMVQSPSSETNWFAASQEIPLISRNPKVHYRTHKRPPTVCILGQPNPVHIPTSHLL